MGGRAHARTGRRQVRLPDARQRIRLRVLVSERMIRVEVIDGGAGLDVAMRAAGASGGWGLCLVDALAGRWGVVRDSHDPRLGPRPPNQPPLLRPRPLSHLVGLSVRSCGVSPAGYSAGDVADRGGGA
jgi:hypothetical protein